MDIAEIDAFIAENKTLEDLEGSTPEWEDGHAGELSGTWNVVDSVGLIRAQLRFRCPKSRPQFSSISLIYKGNLITRLDLVPARRVQAQHAGCGGFRPAAARLRTPLASLGVQP